MSIPTTKTENMDRKIKIKNGGRRIKLNDIEIDVISGYTPAWTREYSDSFTTWDNRRAQLLRGIRFFVINIGLRLIARRYKRAVRYCKKR